LEIGGKTWGHIDRPYGMSPGNFPYGSGPDDVIIENDDKDDDAWKDACKLIEKHFGEIL
jgi:hypothetical protein